MTAAVAKTPCAAYTAAGDACRRSAQWLVPHDDRFYCRQHAEQREPEHLINMRTGRRVDVTARSRRRKPVAPNLDAIIAAFTAARNPGDYTHARLAVMELLTSPDPQRRAVVKDALHGLKPTLMLAMRGARTRLQPNGGRS